MNVENIEEYIQWYTDRSQQNLTNKQLENVKFVNYKLRIYKYYQLFINAQINKYTRVNDDQYLHESYDQYLQQHIANYKFIQSNKSKMKQIYETKIENICKLNYHPKNVEKLLNEGYDVDEAFSILDKNIDFHI